MAAVQEKERLRLRELDRYGVFGTPPENDYDHIVRLTADIFEVPVAMINLVARDTVWVKSRIGLDLQEVAREMTFCHHTIQGHDLLVVPDLALDDRFCDNPLVAAEDGLRFYAGAPLTTPGGYIIGTLCILDRRVKPVLSPKERERLQSLATLVMDRLEKRRLERLEIMTSSLMDAASEGIVIADARHRIRYWNQAAERIFGFTAAEMTGRPIAAVITEAGDAAVLKRALAAAARGRHGAPLSFNAHSKDGRALSIEISVASWNGEHTGGETRKLSGLGIIVRDVTEEKAAAERLAWLSRHDELTGVLNRNHLRALMSEELAEGRDIAVISINLDRFMAINDTFGHRVGDALLKAVARRLEKEIAPGDRLARTGGDEFTILRSGATQRGPLEAFALRLQAAFGDTFSVDGHLVIAAASVGIATSTACEANTDALLNAADLAIYSAKSEGGSGWRFFSPEHDRRISTVRSMENDLRGALARGEFALHYQPQFDLSTGRLTGAEALIRWTHHARGAVSPAEFIPVAELSGLIVPIGEWVVSTACAALTRLPAGFRMAVNLSPAQFRRSDVAGLVAGALERYGLDPARLEVEITESLLLENNRATGGVLRALKTLGVGIALDDFGTGYSSLAYLSKFPFDAIKIDRSFVQTLETEPGSAAIVRAVVGLGRDFRLKVIAEGVETEEQRRMLREFGCDEGQGYLLARPMPLDALLKIVG